MVAGGRAGAVRPGGGRDPDVPHRGQRGLPAEGGEIQGPAGPAAEVGGRVLRQARGPAGQGDGRRLAAGAGAVELRAGGADRQGGPHRGRAGGAPVGAGGAAGAGGRAGGRRVGDGRGRPEPDVRRRTAPVDGEDRRGAGDVSRGRGPAGRCRGRVARGPLRAGGLPVADGFLPVHDRQGRGGAGRGRRGGEGGEARPGEYDRRHR